MISPAKEDDFEWIKVIQKESGLPLWKPNAASWVFEKKAYAIWNFAGDECELLSIAVEAAERGKGIAKMLMEHCHEKLGAKKYFLEVRELNAAAISLYKKLGYEKISERKGYYSNKETAIIMQLIINH